MPLALSVTMSTLLTVIFLPMAILRVRQSPDFAAMALVAVVMLWRGEAWKAVFLKSEQQVLELQQQRERPILPKTTSFYRHRKLLDAEFPLVANLFGEGIVVDTACGANHVRSAEFALQNIVHTRLASRSSFGEFWLAQWLLLPGECFEFHPARAHVNHVAPGQSSAKNTAGIS